MYGIECAHLVSTFLLVPDTIFVNAFLASSTGENTAELHPRVSGRPLDRRQPLSEKRRIDDVGDLVAALVVGVAETEAVEDEAVALVVGVALVEDGAVLNNDLDHHRANTDHDEDRTENDYWKR